MRAADDDEPTMLALLGLRGRRRGDGLHRLVGAAGRTTKSADERGPRFHRDGPRFNVTRHRAFPSQSNPVGAATCLACRVIGR